MISLVERDSERALREIVAPGRFDELIGAVAEVVPWLPPNPTRAVLDRVGGTRDHFVLHGRVSGQDSTVAVIAEVVEADVIRYASESNGRLRKHSRRQLSASEGGVVAIPEAQLVIRPAGLDHRIPGLRLIHNRQEARALLSPLIGDFRGHGRLLGHRFGKRAVIQFRGADRRCVRSEEHTSELQSH